MKAFLTLVTTMWVVFFSLPALGVTTGTVIGEGARTCKQFSKASGRKINSYIVWVQGYFSAYNAIAPDIQNVSQGQDFLKIKDRLKEICESQPDEYFNTAVQTLIKELHPEGIKVSGNKIISSITTPKCEIGE